MSIKRKMATALATAGLLAGIFGSTLAPVAQAAGTINTKQIWAELTDPLNVADDYYEFNGGADADSATGKTSYPDGDPWVIYAPEYNDGAADDGSILYAVCSEVADTDIETVSGDDVSDNDDVTVTASATGGALVYLDDAGSGSSVDFSDYSTSATHEADDNGFTVCVTAPDDDSSFATTLTVKVNGEALKPIYAVIVGPAQTMTLQDKTIAAGTLDKSGWVAMDNAEVNYAARLRVFDKQGANMVSWIGELSVIEDYAISGYESDGYAIEYTIGNPANGASFTGDVFEGSSLKKVDFGAAFCDSYTDEAGDTKTITPVFDYDANGDVSSSDKKQTAGAITVGCSADGSEASVSGIDFGQTKSVAAGDVANLFIRLDDGYGHPLGVGTTFTVDPGFNSGMFYYQYWIDYPAALIPSPAHWTTPADVNNDDSESWLSNSGAVFEYEYQGNEEGGVANSNCNPLPMNETSDAPTDGDDLTDFMGTTDDAAGAGSVRICYYASQIDSDLGVNSVKLVMSHPYSDAVAGIIGNSPLTARASITVTAESGVALGTTVKVGKKTVSVTGRVGSKVTFVVESSAGVTKTYSRIVGADGKAKFVFKVRGTFDVYAMQGDSITELSRISVKL
ncbi:MAG: hypothetical protein RIR19_161 [Chloroflexota bacterium]|jgi:hypothetical protein